MNLFDLERHVSHELTMPVVLAACRAEAAEREARADWRHQAGRFSSPSRRRDWLCGRLALARLLDRLDRSEDAAQLCWPNPELSLTHSGGLALAAGSVGSRGMGVDYESCRPVDPRTARWFLRDVERRELHRLSGRALDRSLLLCWTQKEALFKACRDNAELVFTDIELSAPGANSGTASVAVRPDLEFRFVSSVLLDGILSVAIALPRKRA